MKVFVKCQVLPGMFDSEYLIKVADNSTLVSRRIVRRIQGVPPEAEGEVQAYLVDKKEGNALVELPGEPVFGGTRTWVPATAVEAA